MKHFSLVILLLATSILYAAYPDEYPGYLQMLGFSKDEIRGLQHGGAIVRPLLDARRGEHGISAAKVFDVPGYFIRDYFAQIENFKNLQDFQEAGKFKDPPDLQDLAPLTFDPEEIEELLACRQHCALNLTPAEIAGIQGADPEQVYRKILMNRLAQYVKKGDKAKADLQEFPHLAAYFPRVLEYLERYPASKDRQTLDFFYWTKEKLGKQKVVQLRHVFSQRIVDDFVMVNHLIYSNHAMLGSASVVHLINYVDSGAPRTLLVYHARTYVDPEIMKSAGQDKKFFAGLRFAAQELENRYLNPAYRTFPYELRPTDQR
jgi:hypothetical protein